MYIVARNVNGRTEYLKDSSSTSNKTFDDFSIAENFVKKLNTHTQSDKKWYVMELEDEHQDEILPK
ncbi:hypothetical protein ACFFJI_02285 [Allobacillus sp. GCM10007491]|uniref:Uncharacterized protein n=1 Tax=Allobacillus saliphilus TaxID=2912308 RepID=A0A941HTK6_9BACI|nr:hypothetical protein [Allobacillus saliphilus]MBR7554032.1 hypothetical protein [Allobacillus saliphilus]